MPLLAALAPGGGLAGLAPATWAATPSCGGDCIDIFNEQFGTHAHPGFVLDMFQQAAESRPAADPVPPSNSDPAEDYTFSYQGHVSTSRPRA